MKYPQVQLDSNQPYKLGHAIIYPDRNLVVRDDKETQLPQKCFRLLKALLLGEGNSVRREDLLDYVWGTHLGSDELLNNAISKLRNAIGVEFKSRKTIETVPKFGYRLCIQPRALSIPSNRWRQFLFKYRIILLLILLFCLLLSMAFFKKGDESLEIATKKQQGNIIELTKLRGSEYAPDYSPNGQSLLFAQIKPDTAHADLFLQDLQSGDVRQITVDKAKEFYPSWNRAGDYIAYISTDKKSCKIMVMYMLTNEKFKAYDCTDKWLGSLAWSPDGEHLISSWRASESLDDPFQIYHINWRSNKLTPLFKIKSKGGDLFPRYSPSGNYLAWSRVHEKGGNIIIYDLKEKREVSFKTDLNIRNLHWSHDNEKLYIVSIVNRQKYKLSALNITYPHMTIEDMTMIDGISSGMSVNPVNGNIAFDQYTARQQLLVIDMNSGLADFSMESSYRDDLPVYSPSGNVLSFRSNRSGREGLWLINKLGFKGSRLLFDSDKFINGYTWLNDEKSLIYSMQKDKYYQLFLYDIEQKQHSQLLSGEAHSFLPVLSRDGTNVYFTRVGADVSIVRLNLISQKSEKILENAYMLRESPDAKWFYFFQLNKAGLWRIPASSEPLSIDEAELFIKDLSKHDSGNWVLFEKGVIYLTEKENNFIIRTADWANNEIWPPIKLQTELMRQEGTNFAFNAQTEKLIVVTDDHYTGNIQQYSAPDLIITGDKK